MRDLCRFILVLCLALTGLAYASDSHVGVLKHVSGQVVVVRAGLPRDAPHENRCHPFRS